jgi:hypothetical protein
MPSVYIDSRVLGGVLANTGSAIVVVEYFVERAKQKRRCDVTWHGVFREDKPQPTSRWQYTLFIRNHAHSMHLCTLSAIGNVLTYSLTIPTLNMSQVIGVKI